MLSQGLGLRGMKNPGWPCVIVIQELAILRALRNASPSGVKLQILRSVMRSQNVRSRSSLRRRELPAMIAELMAPIDTPDTQSGSMSTSCSA